ncbi:ABC transporter substrate-binding protein [Isoptericola variabilis]|uniref:ABC-type transporter, periplasmic subunit n=1 Tax=Isoptericola variabilis (strain 225) TaxID=743718 RepID=F6FR45_ISOV2|nr:ABC transporter substrate-binding protein [Isoptericola variabilis]AEG44995.1 ABC-type transporter, periplasmic subunit [Isoptericola variabilis 225]TWH25993.1 peptide/nickel transport system substrate-binding protein [Isoptericola variabilis J7]
MTRRTTRVPAVAKRSLALLAVGALLLSGCSGGAASSGGDSGSAAPTDGVLRLGVLNDIGQPPDPDVYYSGNGLAITTNAYEGLVRYEPGNHDEAKIVPALAESWEVNDDFTEYTFVLRQGVKFHDGTDFDSSAVEASFQRRLDVDAGPAYMVQGVAGVEEIDAHTVTVTLSEPNSAFLDYLASPYGPRMISPSALEEHAGDDFAQTYLSTTSAGTGPYVLSEAVVGEGYQLTYFEDYWGDLEPEFTTVELPVYTEISAMQLELENGDLHALLSAVPTASRQKYLDSDELQAYALPSFQVGVMYMNPNRELLAEAEARRTLFEGIDWVTLIDQVTGVSSVPAEGYYPKGALPADVDSRELVHDPAALEQWVSSLPAGTPIQIGHSAGGADAEQMANIIAAQLQALGMQATVTSHQSSEIFGDFPENPESAPDVMIAPSTWPDSNNAYMHGHVFWDPDGGLNHLQCSDETTTALLQEAVTTGSDEKYVEAGEAAYEAGCAPTFAWSTDFMVAQNWLQGLEESHSIAAPATLDFATLGIGDPATSE